MSLSVEEVARHVAALTETEEDVLLIGKWIDARWQELAASNNLRMLLREGELFMPAPYTTGTVDATRGSTTVAGTSTAWNNSLSGRHIRIKSAWYQISHVVNPTSLELATAYGEDTITGAGYTVVQRRLRLSPDVRKLGVFVHMRLRRPLITVSKPSLDMFLPSRYSVNSLPTWAAEVEADVDGVRRVEIYPYSNRSEIIHYAYWITPPTLGFHDLMPDFIDTESFREGVLVDVYRHKMHKAVNMGNMEAAALWRNEYRAQETRWAREHRVRVMGQEQSADDTEFILQRSGAGHPAHGQDRIIENAYDQVWYT